MLRLSLERSEVAAHLVHLNLHHFELLEDGIRVNLTCHCHSRWGQIHSLESFDATLMISQGVVVVTQGAIGLVSSSLKRLHASKQVVQLVEGVLVETGATGALEDGLGDWPACEFGNLLFKRFNTLDGVLGRSLGCKDVHQLSYVKAITGHWHIRDDNVGFVLQCLNIFCVLVDQFLVCIHAKHN